MFVIYSIEGNRQRLDGGSMFGNVPHALWSQWIAPDERLRIPLACRPFLIHDTDADRRILLEAGIGCFFEPKLMDRFGVQEKDHRLLAELATRGIRPERIDFVVISHLHFDHAGGLLSPWKDGAPLELVFPNAHFIVGRAAWARAKDPHPRDRASFVPELNDLLERSGRLELVDDDLKLLGDAFSCTLSDGHTPGLLLCRLTTDRGSAAFCGDLIPGLPWVHLPVTMGYDRFPELLIDEKRAFLDRCREDGTHLLFTHDPRCASARVTVDEKGRYKAVDQRETLDGLRL
jgi:glyoxylase-like metal-dependent hydrolase (beta-lactamase superfamily II)